jgi:hypothetical protein
MKLIDAFLEILTRSAVLPAFGAIVVVGLHFGHRLLSLHRQALEPDRLGRCPDCILNAIWMALLFTAVHASTVRAWSLPYGRCTGFWRAVWGHCLLAFTRQ